MERIKMGKMEDLDGVGNLAQQEMNKMQMQMLQGSTVGTLQQMHSTTGTLA